MESQSRTRWRDTWLPGLLLALGAAEMASLHTPGWVESIGLEAVAALLLVFRRRLTPLVVPLAALCLALIPLTGTRMDEASAPILFYILGVFSLGRWLRLRPGIVLLVVVLATVFLESLWLGPGSQDWTDVVFVLALGVPPFAFGRIVKRLDEQGRLLAAQQGLIKAQAVQEERDRIARELHDVLAHSISAMVIQSAAAREVVGTRPDRAADLLDQVAETGRSALAETARLLHLVRDDARELGLSPAPGLADVPALVESVRDGGLDLHADLRLPDAPLPGGIDVSAYRIVQEVLTNAMKYATGPVTLGVAATPDRLRISASNEVGTGVNGGSGLGLKGMAERVAMLGGRLSSGATPDGRFALEADIPLTPVAP